MCGLSISNDVDVSLFLQAFTSYDAIGICLLIVSGHRILRFLPRHKLRQAELLHLSCLLWLGFWQFGTVCGPV